MASHCLVCECGLRYLSAKDGRYFCHDCRRILLTCLLVGLVIAVPALLKMIS